MIEARKGLKAIAVLSAVGLLFSGYLTFQECGGAGASACGAGGSSLIFGLPACIYGFVMYLLVFAISLAALNKRK